MKKFLLNKLSDLINVDDDYGVPNKKNQDLFKESFLLEELMEVMEEIWPDEHYLRSDFEQQDQLDKSTSTLEPHKEVKTRIAGKILELL